VEAEAEGKNRNRNRNSLREEGSETAGRAGQGRKELRELWLQVAGCWLLVGDYLLMVGNYLLIGKRKS
jgi:hypothetical protein